MAANFPAIFGNHGESEAQRQPSFVGKVVLWIAILASLGLMLGFSLTFSIPSEPGFSASLLQQHGWVISLFVVFVAMIVVMMVSAVLGSSLRGEAPVMCTALACAVISWRGGTMQSTLFYASGPSVFVSLTLEVIVLFAALVGAWEFLQRQRRGAKQRVAAKSEQTEEAESLDEKLLAVFTQASAMMALMILLCRGDSKKQCLASVFVASAAAAAIAMQLVTVRSSFWLWIGPVAVAVFGYVFAIFHADGWQVGLLHGPLAALSRPLPLDYVSMGPAGAIFGYWTTISSGQSDEEEQPDSGGG